jgi:hypothetical protein
MAVERQPSQSQTLRRVTVRSGLAKHRSSVRRQATVDAIFAPREWTPEERATETAYWAKIRELNAREDREREARR